MISIKILLLPWQLLVENAWTSQIYSLENHTAELTKPMLNNEHMKGDLNMRKKVNENFIPDKYEWSISIDYGESG